MRGIILLKCICDDTRFEILEILQKNKEMCVNDFVEKMKKDQPLISHHLKTLKKCGIVKSRDKGKKSLYSISNVQMSDIIANIIKASKEIPVLCNTNNCC